MVNANQMLPEILNQSELKIKLPLSSNFAPQAKKPILSVKDMSHVYPDGTKAIHNISLDINEGEYVLIIGQNGAGKSTLVKHFLNLLKPTQGIVKVNGVDTRELTVSNLARRIGYVAQNPDNQIFNATVEDEVAFALKNLGHNKDEVVTRTNRKYIKSMGLLDFRSAHPLALPKRRSRTGSYCCYFSDEARNNYF